MMGFFLLPSLTVFFIGYITLCQTSFLSTIAQQLGDSS
ncbi:hypothetical protein ENHAE0001_0387 [Enhydrobacter aerosaccus SK60]|nr:hypothetical protein ENHAE0001_0387 [Enhydrobacter aerosaccus SK60]